MRVDGRQLDDLRAVSIEVDFTENPLASVLCAMGRTKVLCTVTEDLSVPRWMKGSGRGWVTAEYSLLPGSTDRRTEREAARGKQSGRTHEIQRLIGRSLRAVFDLRLLGERTLHIDCDVIQADGGTRTAAITGGYVAAVDAARWLRERGMIENLPLRDQVAAVSVGVMGSTAILDLDYAEDSQCETDMNVVMTGRGRYVEVQGTAEGEPFTEAQMTAMMSLARKGILELVAAQKHALGQV